MGRPPTNQETQDRNDPIERNNPRTNTDGFEGHIWTSLNQIFERLGKLDQKIDQLATDQGKLKDSVEKHDKLILRVTFTLAGAVVVFTALWFIYEHFLKDHIALK
jgi:hypothetical protein